MKRDMDLARKILFAVEAAPYDGGLVRLDLPEHSEETVTYHVLLLAEAGLLEAKDLTTMGGVDWQPVRLTWEGHEFLESARDDGRWQKAKQTMKEKVGGITFETLKALLAKMATEAVLGAGS